MSEQNEVTQLTQEQLGRAIQETTGMRISLAFMLRHPWEFKPCEANSKMLADFIKEHNLDWSEDSLEKAFTSCKPRMAAADPPKLETAAAEVQTDPLGPLPKGWPLEVPFQTRRDVRDMPTETYRHWFHSSKQGAAFRSRVDAILRSGK